MRAGELGERDAIGKLQRSIGAQQQVGAAVEQDTPYRIRQQSELGAQGSCNLSAIAVDIIEALAGAPTPQLPRTRSW